MAKIIVDEKVCKGCGMCVHACPLKIIALDKTRLNAKGYHPAQLVEPEKCVGCGRCSESCPSQVIRIENGKAHIHYKHCIRCYCCHEMCPVKAIHIHGRV